MASTYFQLLCLIAFLGQIACRYPENMTVVKDFRQITVSFDEIPDFNRSGDATQHLYEIHVEPVDLQSYFVSSSLTVLKRPPNITLSNLLTNSKFRLRVALKKTQAPVQEHEYSPWYQLATKDAAEAGNVLIPGKVLNLNAIQNPNNASIRSAIITFNDPTNVQSASDANDKSIQYRVKGCTHNILAEENSDCITLTEFVKNPSSVSQTTESVKDSHFFQSNIHPDKNKDIAFVVSAFSLNGTEGPAEQVVRRLNPASKPAKPTGLNSSDVYADELKIIWTRSSYLFQTAYIRYNIKGNSTTKTKTTSMNYLLVTGLKNETTYEFQVGLYTKDNGGSDWSDKYEVTTTNTPKPTQAPPPSSSAFMTSSILLTFFLVFIAKLI